MTSDAALAPIWLLDVDGVVNALTGKPDRQAWSDWRQGTASADGVAWPICFSPTVVRLVRRLHETDLAEVHWLSTWGRHANGELRRLLELPALPVAGEPPAVPLLLPGAAAHGDAVDVSGPWWKLSAAAGCLSEQPGRPVIWTDDELRFNLAAARSAIGPDRPRLLLSPPPSVGLTPRLLRQVETFCSARSVPATERQTDVPN